MEPMETQHVEPEPSAVGGRIYKVDEDLKKAILEASSASEIPIGERNKLYSAIRRTLERPRVDARIVARWASDSESNQDKFRFLQEWVKDTSCATLLCKERHKQSQSSYNDTMYCWITKFDLYTRLGAYHSEEAKDVADTMMKNSKSKPYPLRQLRDDPRFRLYHVLQSMVNGERKNVVHETSFSMTSQVDAENKDAAEVAADVIKKMDAGMGQTLLEEPPSSSRAAKRGNEEPRLRKLHDDIAKAREVAEELGAKNLKHSAELQESLGQGADALKEIYTKLQTAMFDNQGDVANDIWKEAETRAEELTADIQEGLRRLSVGKRAKPWVNPWNKKLLTKQATAKPKKKGKTKPAADAPAS
eukprot:9382903-Lingulodinium_polyedra.AAC.1